MPKPEKVEKVKELAANFRDSSGALFADFRGLTVKDAMELRRSLRDAAARFVVVKNTLTQLAAREAGIDGVDGMLTGPTAVTFIAGDPVAGAKALVEASRRFPTLAVKGAVIEGRVLDEEAARGLATLDRKEISVARVAGLLQAPLSRMTYLLRAPLQRIAFALAERGRQDGEEGGGPAAVPVPGR